MCTFCYIFCFLFVTGISATVSLVSLCWAIAVYSRIHRRVREDKKVVSWPGVVLQAVWRIGMISSRVIALVLFATVFKAYVFLVIGKIHLASNQYSRKHFTIDH